MLICNNATKISYKSKADVPYKKKENKQKKNPVTNSLLTFWHGSFQWHSLFSFLPLSCFLTNYCPTRIFRYLYKRLLHISTKNHELVLAIFNNCLAIYWKRAWAKRFLNFYTFSIVCVKSCALWSYCTICQLRQFVYSWLIFKIKYPNLSFRQKKLIFEFLRVLGWIMWFVTMTKIHSDQFGKLFHAKES